MKKLHSLLLSLLLIFIIVGGTIPAAQAAEFAGGTGTAEDPYLISTAAHLNNVRNHLDGHFKMTADIVFNEADFAVGGAFYNGGTGWEPIGDATTKFTGSFDGNGHTITGLYQNISATTDSYAGLFGCVDSAVIKNLGMVASNISGNATSENYYAGGIVGGAFSSTTITNCYNTGVISGYFVGGIAGYAADITISNCYNIGTIKGNTVGGIVGYGAKVISISSCYNASIIGAGRSGGMIGLAAYTGTSITTPNCYYLDTCVSNIGNSIIKSTKCDIDQMRQQSTFAGFDFETVWQMGDGDTYTLPTLRGTAHVEKEINTSEFEGGNGTTHNPYLISNKTHLNNVRNHLGACFKLMVDIVFVEEDFLYGGEFYDPATGGAGWNPIGDEETPFTGIFDGNGHTIEGLYQNFSATDNYHGGLFGYSRYAIIKNLGIVNSEITSNKLYAGAILGHAYSTTISNCYNTSTISGGNSAGGIVGYDDSCDISNCYNTGVVSGYNSGGIAGYAHLCIISSCFNIGTINGNYAGGIVGYGNSSACIYDCYNTGNIGSNDSSLTGGIVGFNSGAVAKRCYNTGMVSGNYAGGITGNDGGYAPACYYLDNMSVGAGRDEDETVQCTIAEMQQQNTFAGFNFETVWQMGDGDTYMLPTLRGIAHVEKPMNTTEFAGGNGTSHNPYLISTKEHLNNVRNYLDASFKLTKDIIFTAADFAEGGAFYNSGEGWQPIGDERILFTGIFDGNNHTIAELYQNISASSTCYGGLFGYTNNATIKNLGMKDSSISVSSTSPYSYAGSIVGYAYSSTIISNCYNTGIVYAGHAAGGIVGRTDSSIISNCYNTGTVSARFYAGGIVSYCYLSNISNCCNNGNVTGCYAGGIVGYAKSNSTVATCYNTGAVDGNYAGGIAGYASSPISNCYYLDNVALDVGDGKDGGTKCTDAELQYQGTFRGFNFADVWTMSGNPNYLYPELRAVPYNTSGALVSATALSWNSTNDAVYVLYSPTVTDDAIKNEWKVGSYSGVVCASVENPVSTTVDGKTMYAQTFSFYELSNGNYKLAIFKPGKYVPKIISVSVNGSNVSLGQQKLWLYGDVTGDGKVNATDATNVLYYYTHKPNNAIEVGDAATLADRLLCADVNLDGKINATDATQILSYYTHKPNNVFNNLK